MASRVERGELELIEEPVAIVQAGVFAYANHAFLEFVGVPDLPELMAIPLLDLISATHRKEVKEQLTNSINASGALNSDITLVNTRGEYHQIGFATHTVNFDDEPSVQVTVDRKIQKTFMEKVRAMPWAFNLSILFLILFSTLPPILLQNLKINNSAEVYFPDSEPAVVVDRHLREYFPNDQVIVMMFEGVALYSDGFLRAFDQLAEAVEEHPMVEKVVTVTTQDHIAGTEDGFEVAPVLDIDVLDNSHPRERPAIATADRFARNVLVSKDASALSMVIMPDGAENSLQRTALLEDVMDLVEEHKLTGYVSASAGQVVTDVWQLREMLKNNMVFIPATTIIGLTLIWWLFRRPLAMIIGGTTMGLVVNSTIALYTLSGRPFTMLSSMTPPLLTALTIAVLVHLFTALQYASNRGHLGRNRVKAALDSIRRPARYSAFTTAAGLGSLGLSPIPGIADFGISSAIGVVIIYFCVIVAVPHLFARWDHAPWPSTMSGFGWMDSLVRWFSRIGLRYPVWVLVITVGLFAVGTPQIFKVKAETNLIEFFAEDHEFRVSTERIDEILVGTTTVDVSFEVEAADGLLNPEYLQQIRDFQVWLEAMPEADKTSSPADFIEEMHWGFNYEQDEYRAIPDDRELITQYLFIYDGEDLSDFLDADRKIARVAVNLNVHRAKEIGAVINEIREYLGANISEEVKWDIAGDGRLFADMEVLLVNGQVYSLSGALVLIFVLMLFLWRSLFQAMVCMLPNLAPIMLIFITMGLLGIWLDMATAMIASVAVGIAVDDTIHVFHGFKHRMNNGASAVLALVRTYRQAGRAVVITTIILVTQFAALMTSDFNPFHKFGMLTTVGLIAALLFDLLVLPAILVLVYRKRPVVEGIEGQESA